MRTAQRTTWQWTNYSLSQVTRRRSHLCLSLCVSGTRTVRGQLSIQSSTRDPVLYTANSVFLFQKTSRVHCASASRGVQLAVRCARPGLEKVCSPRMGALPVLAHTHHHVRSAASSALRYPRPSRRDSRAPGSPLPRPVMLNMEEHHRSLSPRIPRDIPLCRSPFHLEASRRATEPRRQCSKTFHYRTHLLLPYPLLHARKLFPMAGPNCLGTILVR